MRWSSFKYLFRQGLHSMLANRMMTLASLGVLLVCMLLTGFTGLLSANVNSLMEWLGGENEMVVMLDRSATDTEYEVTGAPDPFHRRGGRSHLHLQAGGPGPAQRRHGRIRLSVQ